MLFNYIYWTFGFLRMGTTGLTAQARGRGDDTTVILILLRNLAIALLIGIVILMLQQPLREIGFALLQADPTVLQGGQRLLQCADLGCARNATKFCPVGLVSGARTGQGGVANFFSQQECQYCPRLPIYRPLANV